MQDKNISIFEDNILIINQTSKSFPLKDKKITSVKNCIFQINDHQLHSNSGIKIITEGNPSTLATNLMYYVDQVIDKDHLTLFLNANQLPMADNDNLDIKIECNSVSVKGNVPPGLNLNGRRGAFCGDQNINKFYAVPTHNGDYLGAIRWNGNIETGYFSSSEEASSADSATAEFEVAASECWSKDGNGSLFQMWATPIGTTKRKRISIHSPEKTSFFSNEFEFKNLNNEEYLTIDSNGNIKISGMLQLENNNIPSSANSPGEKGQIVTDENYIYICIATDTWKRSKLNSW